MSIPIKLTYDTPSLVRVRVRRPGWQQYINY